MRLDRNFTLTSLLLVFFFYIFVHSAARVNRAISDQPAHAAGRHLLSVIQAATNNWASLYPALANGHRLKRTPSNYLWLSEILFYEYALVDLHEPTDKPPGPGFELRTSAVWQPRRPCTLQRSGFSDWATEAGKSTTNKCCLLHSVMTKLSFLATLNRQGTDSETEDIINSVILQYSTQEVQRKMTIKCSRDVIVTTLSAVSYASVMSITHLLPCWYTLFEVSPEIRCC